MQKTQEQKVIEYINKYGAITSLDAFRDLGITRLSAKIFNLRNEGYNIIGDFEKTKNRFGEKVTYKKYWINKMVEDNMEHIPRIN